MADFTHEMAHITRTLQNGDRGVSEPCALQDLILQSWTEGKPLKNMDRGGKPALPAFELLDDLMLNTKGPNDSFRTLATEVVRNYSRTSDQLTPEQKKECKAAEAMSDALLNGDIDQFKRALKDARACLTPEQLKHGSTSHGYWEKPGFVEPLPIPKGATLYRPGQTLPRISTGPESPIRPENGPSDSPYRPMDVIPKKPER